MCVWKEKKKTLLIFRFQMSSKWLTKCAYLPLFCRSFHCSLIYSTTVVSIFVPLHSSIISSNYCVLEGLFLTFLCCFALRTIIIIIIDAAQCKVSNKKDYVSVCLCAAVDRICWSRFFCLACHFFLPSANFCRFFLQLDILNSCQK